MEGNIENPKVKLGKIKLELLPVPLKSSHITHSAHESKGRILVIQFKGGKTFTYQNVSKSQYKAFLAADSHGTWLNENIKSKGTYHTYSEIKTL